MFTVRFVVKVEDQIPRLIFKISWTCEKDLANNRNEENLKIDTHTHTRTPKNYMV